MSTEESFVSTVSTALIWKENILKSVSTPDEKIHVLMSKGRGGGNFFGRAAKLKNVYF